MPKILPVPVKRLRKVFERAGFTCRRVEGDHYVFSKSVVKRPIVIPDRDDVPVFIIRNNLKSAGISREEYFSLPDEA